MALIRLMIMHAPPAPGGGEPEDDYLDRLAKSILSQPKAPPPGVGTSEQEGSSDAPRSGPQKTNGNDTRTREENRPSPPQRQETQSGAASSRDWVRSVEFYDQDGRFIPGTILVFEDGSMGIYRSFNANKDYDIVYQILPNGKAKPHGMPLYAYEVEPVGRISQSCLEHLVKTSRWERDMIVFHLLKYRDRVHIPEITADAESENETVASSDNVSRLTVQKLTPDQLAPEAPEAQETPKEDKPALVRGRHFSISFGGNQRWNAVYWGKDELGHVVVHNTHDKWSLMHLDLNRFKDTMVFGEMASPEEIARMEKDFAAT